ncbi:hypothetical protein V1Y59_14115 [Gordonia sp. PKS22-38]|uniref:Uncharacterized protein n=1 Tax=Gordonia prachuapensis TaxID=3115651 RepID=A0ABU7MV47_9ACTN|nr:hypothetical protein [Gordonia sp. PKS22-38]
MGHDSKVPRGAVPAIGAVALGARAVVASARIGAAGAGFVLRLPVVGPLGRKGIERLDAEGDRVLAAVPALVDRVRSLVVVVVTAVIEELDLTTLVRENVDLNAIAEALDIEAVLDRVDLDAVIRDRVDLNGAVALVDLDGVAARIDIDGIAARIDIDAILGRVDLIGLADEIIEGVDLPDIIREASTSVTADVMTDVRSTSERADDAVAQVVGRILRRARETTPDD